MSLRLGQLEVTLFDSLHLIWIVNLRLLSMRVRTMLQLLQWLVLDLLLNLLLLLHLLLYVLSRLRLLSHLQVRDRARHENQLVRDVVHVLASCVLEHIQRA